MDTKRIAELVRQLHILRLRQMQLEGDDPEDTSEYRLYPPATLAEVDAAETASGMKYPDSFRAFLFVHNGWLGFWPDWSLVGTHRSSDDPLYRDVVMNLELLPKVVGPDELSRLPEMEKADPKRILITNHVILGTNLNGGFLVFDRNRPGPTGEPEITSVRFLSHAERRWPSFEALLLHAIADTEKEVRELEEDDNG